ncbi:hypothetical protein [Schlesneria paludicola]|uniref:hypothetical protein n=1 Tax=Schlesneria paludicola TaxID=360056 RepID=UPI00029A58F9|nr:hypothetical protein [Schlesneria paludicola]
MSVILDQPAKSMSLSDCRHVVQRRLAAVRRRVRSQLFLEGMFLLVCLILELVVASFVIDRWFRPDLTLRVTMLVAALAAIGYAVLQRFRNPLFLKLDDLDLAEILERRQKGVGQRLTNVLQLPQLLEQDKSASSSMIEAAVREDFVALESVDLQAMFDSKRRRSFWLMLVGCVTAMLILSAISPSATSTWARRWFGGANIRWPQKTYLSVVGLGEDDRVRVPSGESVMIQVNVADDFSAFDGGWRLNGRGEPLIIEGKERPTSAHPDNVAIKLVLADGSLRIGNFSKFAPGQYRYELPPLSKPAQMTITGGDDWFGPVGVEPIDRPSVEHLELIAHIPGKSEPEIIRADDAEQQLLFIPTTKLELELTSTQPLFNAKVMVTGAESATDLQRVSERTYRMDWEAKDPVTFEFQLIAESGGLNSKPHFLTIGILNDRPPRLTLRSSGVGRRVTPVAQVPLHLRVMDDFGVAKLSLELEDTRVVEQKPTTVNHKPLDETLSESGQKLPTDIEREPILQLSQYNLVPGATVRVRGLASDACVLGTQSAESRWLSFQVVSAEELFYEILTRQREARAKLAKAIETGKTQLDSLRKLTAPSEAGAIVRVHQGLARQVWQIAGQLNGTLQEMTLNDLGNATARQLLENTIIKPLFSLHATPLTELRGKIEALTSGESIDEERLAIAMTAQTETVEQMQKIMDQMSQWESFIDVVNQLRHVIASQEKIRESTETTQKDQIKGVFDDE